MGAQQISSKVAVVVLCCEADVKTNLNLNKKIKRENYDCFALKYRSYMNVRWHLFGQ